MNQPGTAAAESVKTFTLTNKSGMRMVVTNFGGKIMSLWVPDRNGQLGDVVLGYDSAKQYVGGNPFFGAAIGRYGNRIAKGKFSLDGKEYTLAINNPPNALHGGPGGFHNVYWLDSASSNSITLTYLSKDGEEGYPGNLSARITYTLTDDNELRIDYSATTDKPTVVNLTQHSYFNLAGAGNPEIGTHEIMIDADRYLAVDSGLIPVGIRKVDGTPFDFRKPRMIGKFIGADDEQIKLGKGYDHNWILNKKPGSFALAARVSEPTSGRIMEVWTTEPGLQFYSGNFLNGSEVGKDGKRYPYRSGFCLETQHFPDSPNHPEYPSTVLRPGETYSQRTVYKFLTAK